jgi:hypothetical protein
MRMRKNWVFWAIRKREIHTYSQTLGDVRPPQREDAFGSIDIQFPRLPAKRGYGFAGAKSRGGMNRQCHKTIHNKRIPTTEHCFVPLAKNLNVSDRDVTRICNRQFCFGLIGSGGG